MPSRLTSIMLILFYSRTKEKTTLANVFFRAEIAVPAIPRNVFETPSEGSEKSTGIDA